MDMKLMRMVPDLISMPDVTLEPVIHVLYHSILHYGASFPSHYTMQQGSDRTDYPTAAYIGALRSLSAWQKEATGTKTDFAAAILMVRAFNRAVTLSTFAINTFISGLYRQ